MVLIRVEPGSRSLTTLLPCTVLKEEVITAMQLAGLQSLEDADPALINTGEVDPLVPQGSRHPYVRKAPRVRRAFRL